MTDTTEVAEVRARLEAMVALADTVAQYLPQWSRVAERCGDETDLDIGAFIAAATPDLLLRVAQQAFHILDRHSPYSGDPDVCSGCASENNQPVRWPCPEVASILRAWLP